jgi:hypothetical protein
LEGKRPTGTETILANDRFKHSLPYSTIASGTLCSGATFAIVLPEVPMRI